MLTFDATRMCPILQYNKVPRTKKGSRKNHLSLYWHPRKKGGESDKLQINVKLIKVAG